MKSRMFSPWIIALLIAVILVAPAVLGRFTISLLNDIGIAALVTIGLILLTGFGGVTSFGQAAFVGIAAYASGWLTTAHGYSPWIGLPISLLTTGGTALLIGLLTLRLGGPFLPISTIAWGLSIPLVFANSETLGRQAGITSIPPLAVGDWSLADQRAIYYLIWLCVLVACLLSYNLLYSRPGRAIRSLRGGAVLLASVGADAFRLRLMLFVTSALLAGLAGWLYAHKNRFVSPSPFDLGGSIEYVIMAVVGGLGYLAGAVLGSGLVFMLKNALQDLLALLPRNASQLHAIVFSVFFIFLIHRARGGAMSVLARWARRSPLPRVIPNDSDQHLERRTMPARGSPLLTVSGIVKRFGGLVAINNVSFEVRAGEIVGLIGPNGAGKSTMFNIVTGTLKMSSGAVRFLGRDVSGLQLREMAKLGIGRTFQHVKLRPNMTLLDNVAFGANVRTKAGVVKAALRLDRAEERSIQIEAWRQLERVGLADQAMQLAGNLPLGTQRLLEVARALASDPVLLVVDEPAAGLRRKEKLALGNLLQQLREEGVTILIVEHDMEFVMTLVDRLVVMNFGSKLAEGLPSDVRRDESVQAAYLGSAA